MAHPVFLSSNRDTYKYDNPHKRYEIVSARPLAVQHLSAHSTREEVSCFRDKLLALKASHAQTIPQCYQALPFICGVLGYLSYDYGLIAMGLDTGQSPCKDSLAYAGYYTWSYVYDHESRQGYITFSPLCSDPERADILARIFESADRITTSNARTHSAKGTRYRCSAWHKTQDFSHYAQQFSRVKAYIQAGDAYQINLAQQFSSLFEGHIESYFLDLKRHIANPYSAFIGISEHEQLCSFSPEQFIRIDDRQISTRPIKGTSPVTLGESGARALVESEKNQAENLMIVDLLRNDLSKSCETHSVKVPKLFELERFSNVHHLVSTITGTLRPDIDEIDALLACFPGGSITGAPKKRAMEIIHELELQARGAYCGSVFYCSDHGKLDSNILIRTVVHHRGTLRCFGGGGIVADSQLQDEYEESLTKVNNITGALADASH